ncbi:MAG: hypothetical protein SFY69_01620 [Planctomycetota bacterium]|nr:hypothetical protein [Planctomycetota bacterium]
MSVLDRANARLVTALLDARDRARLWWRERTRTEDDRRRTIRRLGAFGAGAALLLGVGLYFVLRPTPRPDYLNDPLDDVFNYTLLTDDFNSLPVEQRLALIGQLVQRLKGMDAGDNVLLASFAAGIAGAARDQIEENASRLVLDVWDRHAAGYEDVPLEERELYLESAFIDMAETIEAITGQVRDVSDAERINEVRRQAARDRENLREGNNVPPPEAIGRMAAFMNSRVGGHANPAQRARGTQMLRDMTRHFRGQDISTGRPK